MSNEIDDFGFTFHDESEIESKIQEVVNVQSSISQQKLDRICAIVVPFMENLMQDPDKVMIRWPNRAQIVQQQLNKILSIVEE
jgi:hypothetical protein